MVLITFPHGDQQTGGYQSRKLTTNRATTHISKDLAKARRCCDSRPVSTAQQHRRKRLETKLGNP